MLNNYTLECCIDTVEAAIAAQKGGATRLELCANLIIGGTTPTPMFFKRTRQETNLPINAMVRPRFGDFCYSDFEFEIMLKEIEMFAELGADGVVLGILKTDGSLDLPRMEKAISMAKKLNVTLHRAFDLASDPIKALKDAESLGINTILTSGQKGTALEGKHLIKELVSTSKTTEILVGGDVTAAAIEDILPFTGASAYHMSGKITEDSPMKYRKPGVPMGFSEISEYERFACSPTKLCEAKEVIVKLLQLDNDA